jgi:DNA-binding beta-propeller fold protein YncE
MIYMTDQRRGAVLALESLEDGVAFDWFLPNAINSGPLRLPSGLAAGANGSLAVADSGNNRVVIVDRTTGSSTILVSDAVAIGPLRDPTGVALTATSDMLIVADKGNHRIVFATLTATVEWSALGGTETGAFQTPTDVWVDGAGRILVADPRAARLVRIDGPDGSGWSELTLPGGVSPARPYALAAGPAGGVLVSDLGNSRIVLLAADDTASVLIDGARDRSLIAPVAVALQGGDIVVADAAAGRIGRWASDAAGRWTLSRQIDGRGAVGQVATFSSLAGLAIAESS